MAIASLILLMLLDDAAAIAAATPCHAMFYAFMLLRRAATMPYAAARRFSCHAATLLCIIDIKRRQRRHERCYAAIDYAMACRCRCVTPATLSLRYDAADAAVTMFFFFSLMLATFADAATLRC